MGIESIKCTDVESEWGKVALGRCDVKYDRGTTTYLAGIECFERNGTTLPWEQIGSYSAAGHKPHVKHNGKTLLIRIFTLYFSGTLFISFNNTHNFTLIYKNHSYPGVTYYYCEFDHTGGYIPPVKASWKVTSYPLISLRTGFRVKDITIHVTVRQNKIPNITMYHEPKTLFSPVAFVQRNNTNRTTTYVLRYRVPWSQSQGNATIDVIINGTHFRKTFLLDRHSKGYYTILTLLTITTSIILVAYVVYRIRRRSTTIRYTDDIE
ncbi:a118 [Rat cytomegalovirus ALL-03]|uniref:A118 n=2 Tax=Rat cytomegalovirus (isolate England) TaxID=1261657 RepID=A0A0F6R4C2_RCMVE|nr:E118 [Murid betaherpesvirus 8]AFX83426.1 E118 [Murid betaherpesvirus 8]AKE44278.1 a118 [Rat cytomegalovirus ALL-03]